MIVTVVTDHKVDDDLWIKSCEVLGIKIGLRIESQRVATRAQFTISCAHGLIKLPETSITRETKLPKGVSRCGREASKETIKEQDENEDDKDKAKLIKIGLIALC